MQADVSVFSVVAAVCLGASLAAATGFRIFVPCLAVSVAAKCGMLHLSHNWEWMASWPALIAFASANVLEIGAYYIPWIDNALDSIATPSAPIVGMLLTVAVLPNDVKPLAGWTLAIIAGGGTAMVVQAKTTALRALSTAFTGGLANPIVSSLELLSALLISVMAVFLPVVVACVLFLVLLAVWILLARTLLFRRRETA